MSQNSSNEGQATPKRSRAANGLVVVGYGLWLATAFIGAQFIVLLALNVLSWAGISLEQYNAAMLQTVATALAYVLALVLTVSLPRIVVKQLTTTTELGVQRWPKFGDIGLGILGFVPYALLSFAFIGLVGYFYADFNRAQPQEVGFKNLSSQFEYIMAFLALVVVAPVAEELMFRGYLYGKLRARIGLIVSILVTSLIFAVLHFQLNVGVDVFALSIILCLLREVTGSIWAGTLLHMLKNGIAFYFLFVNPIL